MTKNRLYLFAFTSGLAGLAWVLWNRIYYNPQDAHSGLNLCLFKRITGLPCPSCGSTRSVLDIAQLQFKDAFYSNPFGFLLALCIVVFPFWILYDLAGKKSSFYDFFLKTEALARKRGVAVGIFLVVAINWAWNIYKFLS